MEDGPANIEQALARIERDLARASEKLLNLEMLLLRASDVESLGLDSEDIDSPDLLERAFQFDVVSGILISEVNEIELYMSSVQDEIAGARQKIPAAEGESLEISYVEEKLNDAQVSFKRSFDRISEIKSQLLKSERIFSFRGGESEVEYAENGGPSTYMDDNWPMQTREQRKQTLQMLEKSLARELDLEKKLSDSRHNEKEIKTKLYYAEQEIFYLEETVENILERYFKAENVAEVFNGIAKELTGQLQLIQFNLNGSIRRESELRSEIEQNLLKLSERENAMSMVKSANVDLQALAQQADILKSRVKEVEDKCEASESEASTLRIQVKLLEEQLKDANILLQEAKATAKASQEQQQMANTQLLEMENVILDLKDTIIQVESRAQHAETRCTLLGETNLELNQELGFLKSNEYNKINGLEEKLKESDAQLEQWKASYEASEEQQNLLFSTFTDMENVIEDLKVNLSKAEKRAENAESRCNLLTETNLELNEELGILREKLGYLEKSLHQADNVKLTAAKDISIKIKVITDLVVKLALERERLQMQIVSLKKENKILMRKSWKTNEFGESNGKAGKESVSGPSEERAMGSVTGLKVNTAEAPVSEAITPVENETSVESEPPPVRTIEARELNGIRAFMVIIFLVLVVVGIIIYMPE